MRGDARDVQVPIAQYMLSGACVMTAAAGFRMTRQIVTITSRCSPPRASPRCLERLQYYFRSIDNWLDGECISHCKEHKWRSD